MVARILRVAVPAAIIASVSRAAFTPRSPRPMRPSRPTRFGSKFSEIKVDAAEARITQWMVETTEMSQWGPLLSFLKWNKPRDCIFFELNEYLSWTSLTPPIPAYDKTTVWMAAATQENAGLRLLYMLQNPTMPCDRENYWTTSKAIQELNITTVVTRGAPLLPEYSMDNVDFHE
tara:strand:- start:4271 stop:4795 length:525 start_codon:yes stop_codon:yes gene_type:complete